jgi:hypothetical protein
MHGQRGRSIKSNRQWVSYNDLLLFVYLKVFGLRNKIRDRVAEKAFTISLMHFTYKNFSFQ